MTTTLTDRRNAASKVCEIALQNDHILVSEAGLKKQAMAFEAVTQVRLAIEMAGQDTQIVCRITDGDGNEIVFGSRRWTGIGQWDNNAVDFRDFLNRLHQALQPRWDQIRFVEGQSLAFRWIMSALGLAMALVSGFFAAVLILQDKGEGLFLIAPLILGVWLAWLFRPQRPKPYDPAAYANQ